jgi:hypothetical protein
VTFLQARELTRLRYVKSWVHITSNLRSMIKVHSSTVCILHISRSKMYKVEKSITSTRFVTLSPVFSYSISFALSVDPRKPLHPLHTFTLSSLFISLVFREELCGPLGPDFVAGPGRPPDLDGSAGSRGRCSNNLDARRSGSGDGGSWGGNDGSGGSSWCSIALS